MMRLALVLVLWTITAQAQVAVQSQNTYLVFPTLAAALARSHAQCVALHCDGVGSVYWWNVVPLIDGTFALEIEQTGEHSQEWGISATVRGGLNAAEITVLKPAGAVTIVIPAE